MTADFAMQNVLLQMGLSLVGVEGKRIQRSKLGFLDVMLALSTFLIIILHTSQRLTD